MQAHYTEGSIYKHIISMSAMSAIGLLSIFIVDLVDLYFLSLLGEIQMASAVGFAGIILFFTISISIGLMIAMGALVSKAIGAKNVAAAKQYSVNILVICILVGLLVGFGVWIFISDLLIIMGAKGRTLELASAYLGILLPSLPILCVGMAASGALRSVGDARQAMFVTLVAGVINAILDPIFIFTLQMGIEGAAWASVLARVGMMFYALYFLIHKHQLITRFDYRKFKADLAAISQVAVPAILTNIATPIGNAYIMFVLADFGDSAVAGYSIIGRILPVAFCLVFAISGAVGPIIGQNHGAQLYHRVRQVIGKSFVIIFVYCSIISMLLFLLKDNIVSMFNADQEAASLIIYFCIWVAILTIFRGFLFVVNASFNNLGKAKYSTLMNFSKATIGTIPFVYYGAQFQGAFGIILYEAMGAVVFGIVGSVMVFRVINKIEAQRAVAT
ncbi:MAG TPA: MATE family efflux transporter [Oceanospirillales bacterium]|nr:MATE family efflux transporter [Oceanospirillales bacterium]